jgi:hypothetical protein
MGKLAGLKKALDMSTAARMKRARDMGFDTSEVFYHGSPNIDFPSFKEDSFFTADADYASKFTDSSASSSSFYGVTKDAPGVIPVYLNRQKTFDTRNPDHLRIYREKYKGVFDNGSEITEQGLPDWVENNSLAEFLREEVPELGFDSFIVDEGADAVRQRPPATVVLDPSKIRSVNAEFDPEKIGSPNLLASAAPAAVTAGLVGASMAPEEAQAAIAQQEQNQERRRRGEAFAMKREARKQQFAEVMQQLGNVLDLFDVPMQGLSGLARLGYGLAIGEDDALEQAARVTQQPIEDTAYQAGDYVLDKTGSPAAATAVNVLTQFAGPI